ncbi:MAG TPA: class II aldolase/adducin family protein [Burkholderiaceae bacterium]|nr:class II aldolase/adducin family protein [Burkholderiaceae bacterium]
MRIPNLREVVSAEEWKLRCDLAACYRLVAAHGWSDLIFTHLTARLPGPDHHFLINPYGLSFDEITASSLVKIDLQGNKLDDSEFPVNKAGFVIHSAIHKAREDIVCVMHTHTRAGVAISAQKQGLLPISQQSTLVLASLGYHDYEGIAVRPDEEPRLQASLGNNKYLILRNHGLLTVGKSVPEAFLAMYTLEVSCQIQAMAQAGGAELNLLDESMIAVNSNVGNSTIQGATPIEIPDLVWPSLLRRLDRTDPSYKT